MVQTVYHKNIRYLIQFLYVKDRLCVKKYGSLHFITIPSSCEYDIEKLKPYIIMAIEGKQDYDAIQQLHGTEIL